MSEQNEKGISKISKTSKNPIVSIDTKVKDVLKWDSEGQELDFITEPGKFLQLDEKVVRELSFNNRIRYTQAEKFAKEEAEDIDEDWKKHITVYADAGSAIDRMKVKNPDPKFKYRTAVPANIPNYLQKGFEVVPSDAKESIGFHGKNRLNVLGSDTDVLLRIPKDKAVMLDKQRQQKNLERRAAADKEALATSGVIRTN